MGLKILSEERVSIIIDIVDWISKTLDFESNSNVKKNWNKKKVDSDKSETYLSSSELEISLPVESYDKKTAEKLPKLLRCRKVHGFKTVKDIIPKW